MKMVLNHLQKTVQIVKFYLIKFFFKVYADYITSKILEEIYFYDKFKPLKIISSGIFSNGIIENEFYISITININENGVNYYETFYWDILNKNLIPEDFAEQIIIDEKLPYEYKVIIALNIRKQIKNYVINLFKRCYENYEKYHQKEFLENQRIKRKEEKNIIIFLFDPKLEDLLGNKRKRIDIENIENKSKIENKNDLLKQCDSNIIKIDKKILLRKNFDFETKNDSEQISYYGNDETENHSKSHSNTSNSISNLNILDKDLNEKVVIQIEQSKS